MNIKSGFDLDFSSIQLANRAMADAIIREGELQAKKRQMRDRGLESGLGTLAGAVIGAYIGGPSGILKSASLGRSAATGGVSGLALNAASSALSKTPASSGLKDAATDPGQVASAANQVSPMYGTETIPDPNYLQKIFS